MIDKDAVRAATEQLLRALGQDLTREGLLGTPHRVSEMYAEVFNGVGVDPGQYLSMPFHESEGALVLVRDLTLYSVCEHHLLPFYGIAHVGYLPDKLVVGISKIGRVVDCLAHRPQIQERLTGQIADVIEDHLQPRGVQVVIEAEHLCMTMRGVRKPGTRIVTSVSRGIFRDQDSARREFLDLVGQSNR